VIRLNEHVFSPFTDYCAVFYAIPSQSDTIAVVKSFCCTFATERYQIVRRR